MKHFPQQLCLALLLSALALFTFSGCATSTSPAVDQSGLSPVTTFAGDIQDIEVPSELVWDRDKSMAIKTESFNGGIMVYTGRVEPLSLKDFLIGAMRGNKWKLVGESTSQDIMLAFVKPSKTCMMVISEKMGLMGKTRLTLYVTSDRTAAAGLNPFGESVNK
ncbi:MAG TPA: hypothetical protein DDY20_13240 [Desulfobulbaceae bacterium]|nr:hypothetical protein [Desulfobulbaceae bacterium]